MNELMFTFDDVDNLRLDIPITKVDKERRTVSGFATLNNLDKHGDIIDSEASKKAFARFRGNIREMHMPLAVGKMVKFEEKSFTDPETNEEYSGIYVTAKISRGAEDTWQKVVDGVLSGFSIGATVKAKDIVVKEDGTRNRVIKDYELFELSLVDSPANPLANILTIEKKEDGLQMSGIALEALYESEQEGNDMTKLENVLTRFAGSLESVLEKFTGGNDMSDKATETEATTPEVDDKFVDSIVEKVMERLQKSADEPNSEVVTEDEDEAPGTPAGAPETPEGFGVVTSDGSGNAVDVEDESDDDDSESAPDQPAGAPETPEGFGVVTSDGSGNAVDPDDSVSKSLTEILEAVKGLADSQKATETELTKLSTRIETVENGGAVRKSSDVDDSEELVKESFWSGSFSGNRYIGADALDG